MERNADLIIMHSYAPLFVNVNPGGMQWQTGCEQESVMDVGFAGIQVSGGAI